MVFFKSKTLVVYFLNMWQLLHLIYYNDLYKGYLLPLLGVVTVVVVVVVVVVWRETTLDLFPVSFLNVAHMITEEALSNLSVQKHVRLPIMVSISRDILLMSRNSMLYSTAHPVSRGCHCTRRLLQFWVLEKPATLTSPGVTKRIKWLKINATMSCKKEQSLMVCFYGIPEKYFPF